MMVMCGSAFISGGTYSSGREGRAAVVRLLALQRIQQLLLHYRQSGGLKNAEFRHEFCNFVLLALRSLRYLSYIPRIQVLFEMK